MKRQEIGYSRSKQTGFIKSESARSVHTSSARSPQTSHTWEGDPETEIHFPSGTLELALNWFRWPGIGPLPSFWIGQLNEEDNDRPTAPSRTDFRQAWASQPQGGAATTAAAAGRACQVLGCRSFAILFTMASFPSFCLYPLSHRPPPGTLFRGF